MLYAIKLGPIETSEGRVSAYVGFTETHALPPVVSNQDKDGLEQLAQQAQGHDLRCDRGLARAGKPLGFTAAPLPDWARFGRATLAFALARPGGRIRNLDVVENFLASVAAFCRATPWRFWSDNDPLSLTVSGSEFEACIMGAGCQEYGIALYEQKGAVKKITRLIDAGRMQDAAALGSLAVTVDDEPRWAAKAIGDAFGAACVPVPLKISAGRPRQVDEGEMVTLAAALRAIAGLDADRLEATSDLLIAGSRIAARVIAPKPDLVFGELSEDEAMQIALEAQRAVRRGVRKRK
ncbi:MAG: hypothetical protein E6J58_18770 [Deltaproteobacteria bacterium]|nr:MAG: hypothetical protein E6J58_18770 [Deltaproteobacteria bacterium]